MTMVHSAAKVVEDTHRILVVDDEPDLRDGLMALLKIRGYAVTGAGDGREALRRIDRGAPPHVIVLDLIMPVMTGFELLAELRRDPALRGIYVVAVSATDRPVQVPADAFFQKPYDVGHLLQKIQQLCVAADAMARLGR